MTAVQQFIERQLARLHLLVLLPVFGVLLLTLFWTVIYFRLADERAVAIDDATTRAESLSREYADQSARVLRQIDQATQFIKFSFEQQPREFRLDRLIRRKAILPTELSVRITLSDARGDGIAGVHTSDMTNIGDRDYFKAHLLTDSDQIFISQPLLEPFTTHWSIVISRRLNHADGSFAGIVAIALRQDFLTDTAPSGITAHSFVGLLGADGVLRASRIGATRFAGEERRFAEWIKPAPTRRSIRFIPDNGFDHVSRIVSFSQLDQFPLKAVVGIDLKQALGGYDRHRTSTLWWGLAGTSGIIWFVAMLMLQGAHLRKSQRAAVQAQTVFRAAIEGSLDALTILRTLRDGAGKVIDFEITEVNDRAAKLMGHPRAVLVGSSLLSFMPDLRSGEFFDKYVSVADSGVPLEEEFQLRHRDNFWLHQQIVPMAQGISITTRNISATKAAEFDIRGKRAFLQSLIDHLPLVVYARDMRESAGKMIVWNKTAEIVTGYSADDVLQQPASAVFPEWMVRIFDDFEAQMQRHPMVVDMPDVPFRSRDGSLHHLRIISVPLQDDTGGLEYILGIAEDITATRNQAIELRSKQAELIAANDASPLGLFRTGTKGACTYVNRTYEEMSGQSRQSAMGDGWIEAIHPEDRLKLFQAWAQASRQHSGYQGTYRFRHASGAVVWVAMKAAPILVDGRLEGYVGSVDDITARREAEQALSKSEQRLRTITDTLPALVAFIDAQQRFRFNNLAYERRFNINRDALRYQTVREFVGEQEYAFIAPWLDRALRGETVTFEQRNDSTGTPQWTEATYIPQLADEGKEVVGVHIMIHDISAKKREEQRLLQLTRIDSLTGLVNRAGFEQKLDSAIAQSRAKKRSMALLYLDIDHFKRVNDTHGHLVGDALLKAFAGRLSRTMRSVDTVARLGGDEFTVIMESVSVIGDVERIAAKIVEAMRALFKLDGLPVSISASIGVAIHDGGDLGANDLIKRADEMLYQAKANGRNQYCIWPTTMLLATPTAK